MIEILQANYWEHFKFEKELSLILPLDHPKRLLIAKHSSEILSKIHKIQNKS